MAVKRRSTSELRGLLGSPERVSAESFSLLKELCLRRSEGHEHEETQELILRTLEHRGELGPSSTILNALLRDIGLFPFVDEDELNLADRIALEAHRPDGLDGRVFHHRQARIFHSLLAGRSVVLSAPTSFGKSLIIDALVATKRFNNIVIVVPTLALIDETRRRLARFRPYYTIVTHALQRPGERNLYVMTQERVLERRGVEDSVDFFVIDEFYKLNAGEGGDIERSALLNLAFYTLLKRCQHFYLLGPGIDSLSEELRGAVTFEFFRETYQTVVSELHNVGPKRSIEALSELALGFKDSTLVFCSSPDSARKVAEALPARESVPELLELAADWLALNYHPDWHVVEALRRGIGIHHARLPRSIGQFIVKAFNDEHLQFLACTSTLIEGVNTRAKNIVIYDHKINKRNVDMFTFNNIRGRAGRMLKHFVGHVYVFRDPPESKLPVVDAPVFSQGSSAPSQLLVQLDADDLTPDAEERVSSYHSREELSFATITSNVGIDPDAQLSVARELHEDPTAHSAVLAWRGVPSYPQLESVCGLIWRHFGGVKLGNGSARSPQQLAMMLLSLTGVPSQRDLISQQLAFSPGPDEAVTRVLDFQRLWAGFHFPRLLLAIGRIQREVFAKHGLPSGDYEAYAGLVESFFLDPSLVALEEYGIPLPLARKLAEAGVLRPERSLDSILSQLREANLDRVRLHPFEVALLDDARSHL